MTSSGAAAVESVRPPRLDRPGAVPAAARGAAPATMAAEYAEVVGRARALAPLLRAHADEAEALRRTPDAVVAAIHEAGLFRIVQPRHVGGYEFPATIFFDIGSQLGRACPSTSWVVGNIASHHLLMGLWPEQAQDEVWGQGRDTLIGSSYVFPSGRARRVPDGYRLSGQWPFSSGIHPCQWVALGGMVADANGGPAEKRYFLLPRADYAIVETWDVIGLQGTGSDDVRVDDVFVPEHRTISYDELAEGRAPGLSICTGPLFRFPVPAAGGYVLVSTLYGAAHGALDTFIDTVTSSAAKSSGQSVAGYAGIQQRVARAAALLDTVEMTVRRRLDDAMTMLTTQGAIPGTYAVTLRRDAAYCAELCVQAVDLLFGAGGGSALYHRSPLQRFWRDVHAGAANISLQWDIVGPAYGRVRLGLPSGLPGLSV